MHFEIFKERSFLMVSQLQDDIIDIIAMNASGLWRGACAGRVGNFKFVVFLSFNVLVSIIHNMSKLSFLI